MALSGEGLKSQFAEHKVASLKADWTNGNAEITALLAAQQRSGVPLYLYYAPGAQKPVVLPQLLTESIVLAALKADERHQTVVVGENLRPQAVSPTTIR